MPIAVSIRSSARAEPESVALNPPSVCSEPAIGPPMTPATTTNKRTNSNVRLGRAESMTFSEHQYMYNCQVSANLSV